MKRFLASICLVSVIITSVNAYDIMGQIMSKAVEKGIEYTKNNKNTSSETSYNENSIDYKNITVPLYMKQYFNNNECSQVLNKHYYVNCYDYNNKGSKYVYFKLNKEIMNSGNIKERPQFFTDLDIPLKYRTEFKDYTKNMYNMDRGHILSNDSMNHNYKSQESTFVMSNVVPMLDSVNRGKKSWLGIEKYERYVTNKLGEVEVLNIIYYQNNSQKLGRNEISIPKAFGKILFNKEQNYKKCFYVENKEPTNNKLEELEVECMKLGWK
jgi:endonuclease G, mitochondrial